MKSPQLAVRLRSLAALIEQGEVNTNTRALLLQIVAGLLVDFNANANEALDLRLADLRSEILNEANGQMAAHVGHRIDELKHELQPRPSLASHWSAFWDWLLLRDR